MKDELKLRAKKNLVQSQVFSEKLKKTLNAYHNRAISTMQVLEELIKLAKEMDAATKRGVDLGLTDDEVAFYDALAANESAVIAMGDDKLRVIAAELREVRRTSHARRTPHLCHTCATNVPPHGRNFASPTVERFGQG